MWSSSPCHQRTGTRDVGGGEAPVAGEQQQVVERRRGLEPAAVEQVVEEHRLELRPGQQVLVPRRLDGGVQVERGAGQRPDQPDALGEGDAERHPRHLEQRGEPDRELDRAAVDGVGAAGRYDAAEDADAVHPLGQAGARGEHVGAAAGEADQPAGVDRQRVEQQLEVAGPVADPVVEVRRRGADARAGRRR